MVFIHWGGFFTGSSGSDYLGPEYLMDKDIVLVTFNYRLGVLGMINLKLTAYFFLYFNQQVVTTT